MEFSATIDRFEDDLAVLKTDRGQILFLPKEKLPPNAHEGLVLTIGIKQKGSDEKDKRNLAKQILNEIFKQ